MTTQTKTFSYSIESNSSRMVGIFVRSIEATSRNYECEFRVISQDEKSATVESSLHFRLVDPLVGLMRRKCFKGETFTIKWPPG